jgi:uncharacterized protein YraI
MPIRSTCLAAALAAVLPIAAIAQHHAQPTTTLDVRAGPGEQYPPVTEIPPGTIVTVHGCVNGYSWCDVSGGPERGWVRASQLRYNWRGTPQWLPAVAQQAGIGILAYVLEEYWSRHYPNRPMPPSLRGALPPAAQQQQRAPHYPFAPPERP